MSNQVPEGLPTLSGGGHSPGTGKACVMEYISVLAGEPWTDRPACTHPMLSAVARQTNDSFGDGLTMEFSVSEQGFPLFKQVEQLNEARNEAMIPLIGRLFNSSDHSVTPDLVKWCLGKCEVMLREVGYSQHNPDEFTRMRWLVSHPGLPVAKRKRAETPDQPVAYWGAVEAVLNSAYSYLAARHQPNNGGPFRSNDPQFDGLTVADIEAEGLAAAAHRVCSYLNPQDAEGVRFLTEMIDEYDRLTGRKVEDQQVSTETLTTLARLVQTPA